MQYLHFIYCFNFLFHELFLLSNLLILLSAHLYLPLFHFYPFSFFPSLCYCCFFPSFSPCTYDKIKHWVFGAVSIHGHSVWSRQWLRPNGCGFVIGLCKKQSGTVGKVCRQGLESWDPHCRCALLCSFRLLS